MSTPLLRIASVGLALSLAGCGDAEVAVTNADGTDVARAEPHVAVASDGTEIVFAGAREEARRDVATPPQARRDERRLIREPNSPDPEAGEFTLEEAVVGLPIDGSLIVEINTTFGPILCELHADRAPNTVANFIGLARGLRPWWDARAGEWRRTPYYEGLTFHRVVPGFLVQGGDYLGDGTGTVGYTIADEPHDTLSHDRAGQLCMANRDGPNTAGAQFFLTDGPAPQLDAGGSTIFGQCRPLHVISQLARVPQDPDAGNQPLTPLEIRRLSIRRVVGGLAEAQPTRPQLPEGEPEVPRGASADPTASPRDRYDPRQYGRPSPLPGGRTGPPPVPRPLRDDHHGHNH
ncbi:MAG: peptidylprolyl isomerase [Sandaracinaceae bacterium]|nr:peptidylprolyl isomerase [Sandaracinaceae bacterium]